jgi:PDZ domain/Peptidase family M48
MGSRSKVRGCVLASLSSLALAAGTPAAADVQPGAFDALGAQELRLASVGFRLAQASREACASPKPLTGLVVHDLSEYDPKLRPDVARSFSLGSGYGVLAVVPESPAEHAGLRPKDEILAVDGVDVQDRSGRTTAESASFDRMAEFSHLLDARLEAGPAQLKVRRGTDVLSLRLEPAYGCGGRFHLSLSHTLNAWSDGDYVVITKAIMDFTAADDELAFVIAHEMSHNILGDGDDRSSSSKALFSAAPAARKTGRAMEIRADTYAVRLMAEAGYDAEKAIPFLVRAGKRRWWDFAPLDHPGTKKRIATIRSTWAEVQSARGSSAAESFRTASRDRGEPTSPSRL